MGNLPYSNSTDTTVAGSNGRVSAPSIRYDVRMSPADLDASRGSTEMPLTGLDIAAPSPRPAYTPRVTDQGGL
jgi:hypothetical protein